MNAYSQGQIHGKLKICSVEISDLLYFTKMINFLVTQTLVYYKEQDLNSEKTITSNLQLLMMDGDSTNG